MELAGRDLDSGILQVNFSERMDINGTQHIDLKFTMVPSTRKTQILVDLSNVTLIRGDSLPRFLADNSNHAHQAAGVTG